MESRASFVRIQCISRQECRSVSTEKAEAIVIRQVDFSESSRVVTFFSREFGKFSALAKGAKRLKGPFDAAIDVLSRCRIVFIRKSSGSLHLLTEARLVSRFRPAAGSLSALYGGYYVAELVCSLTEDDDVAPEIFDLTTRTLQALSQTDGDPHTSLVLFEVGMLRALGSLPDLYDCIVCGHSVSKGTQVAHWVSQGGLLCGECRRQEYAGTSITAGTVAVLRKLGEPGDGIPERIRLTKQQTVECHRFAVSAITNLLGRKPKTLRYIDL